MEVQDRELKEKIKETKKEWKNFLEKFNFHQALNSIWDLISFCDKYIQERKPWVKSPNQKTIISDLKSAIENIAGLLKPFLPQTSERILNQLESRKSKILFPKLK
jgi:methionyl-tRNA synthetase